MSCDSDDMPKIQEEKVLVQEEEIDRFDEGMFLNVFSNYVNYKFIYSGRRNS